MNRRRIAAARPAAALVTAAILAAAAIAAAAAAGCSPVPKNLDPPCFRTGDGPAMAGQEPMLHIDIRQEDGKVRLSGLEGVYWGGRTDRQNSVLACLAIAMQARGDNVSYEYLMGVSGAAFRLQFNWCPSAACSPCGFNCVDTAVEATGQPIEWIDTGKDSPTRDPAAARSAIRASIDSGVPLLYASEECGLVVGYVPGADDELLVRPYSADKEGYRTTAAWPWAIGVLGPRTGAPARHGLLTRSLNRAIGLAEMAAAGDYTSGQAAYERWIRDLEAGDEKAVYRVAQAGRPADAGAGVEYKLTDLPPDKLRDAMLGNAYTYCCLIDARLAAARFLRGVAVEFEPAASGHLLKAADLYDSLQLKLCRERGVAPFPWDLAGGAAWTRQMRLRQAALLKEAADLDRQAIVEVRAALKADEGRAVAGK